MLFCGMYEAQFVMAKQKKPSDSAIFLSIGKNKPFLEGIPKSVKTG